MSDRLAAALRRYGRIQPKPADAGQRTAKNLSHWVTEYVCPVVEQLLERTDFREFAKWPMEHLAEDASGPTRELVEAVERGLVDSAARLAKLTRRPVLRKALSALLSSQSSGGRRRKQLKRSSVTAADFIATKPWHDLVNVYDYFGPVADLNLRDRENWLGTDAEHSQIPDFVPYFSRELHLPGDFVSRTLIIRIKYWQCRLEQLSRLCEEALGKQHSTMQGGIRNAMDGIRELTERIIATCLQGAGASQRQACMALLQTFAAYRPGADLSWLGKVGELAGNAARIRYYIDQRGDAGITDHVASALSEIAPLYRSEIPPEFVIAEKSRSLPLVLVYGKGRQELYWQGTLLDLDWQRYRRGWTLMVAMAEQSKLGQGVDALDELGISLKDARHDLKRLLPKELFDRFTVKKDVYRLDLPAQQSFVARFDQTDQLSEVR